MLNKNEKKELLKSLQTLTKDECIILLIKILECDKNTNFDGYIKLIKDFCKGD